MIKDIKNGLKAKEFHIVFLHSSPYYTDKQDGRNLPETDHFTDCLIRLPLFFELNSDLVVDGILG